jgi:hypothetical protein
MVADIRDTTSPVSPVQVGVDNRTALFESFAKSVPKIAIVHEEDAEDLIAVLCVDTVDEAKLIDICVIICLFQLGDAVISCIFERLESLAEVVDEPCVAVVELEVHVVFLSQSKVDIIV